MSFVVPSWSSPTIPQTLRFDIGAVERAARHAIRSVSQGTEAIIRNSVDDIGAIWDSTSACLREIDEIRVRISNRAIEYHTVAIRTLVDAGVLPVQLIDDVWRRVAPDLVRPVNARLFRLLNPRAAVWGSQPPSFVQVTDSASIGLDSRSFFFVHGMDYLADPNDAYQYMYRQFEQEVRLFHEDSNECNDTGCNVYLLSYDSKLTDELDTIIRLGFETELGGPVVGLAPGLFLAVLWRELERRAQVAGDHLHTLLSPLPRGIDNGLFLFSHSLGGIVSAHMANRIYSENPNDGGLFRAWYCMAAAIPANGFQRTGEFLYAPFLTRGEAKTEVYYSFFDDILSTAYVLANSHLAMGNVGSGVRRPDTSIRNRDTTALSREVHMIGGPAGGYFSRVGELIRRDFGIHP